MCSLSWVRRRGSLVVVMNRDERHDRAPARPPRRWRVVGGGFTAPVDGDAGGTWIAARDSGVVVALLNHHASSAAAPPAGARRISRGRLVTALAGGDGIPDAARLRAEGLAAFAPFRLFVIGPRLAPRVFTWTGTALSSRRLDPQVGFLTSSSWNPHAVIAARQARFRAFRRVVGTPTRAELIAFHDQAETPRGRAYAVRMSRTDARTVSRTVVEWRAGRVSMAYQACPASPEPRSTTG
jgi:hypothetical protein